MRERLPCVSPAGDPWKRMRNNARAFLHGDDGIDWDISQLVYLAAGPGDYEQIDLRTLAQSEMDPWIAGRHVARSALCLVHLDDSAGGQPENRANPVAVGFGAYQQHLDPVIAVGSVVP